MVNRGYHRRVAAALTAEARIRLAALLVVPPGANRSGWDQVKADPPRPSPQRMREHLAHLAWLRGQAVAAEAFAGVPDRKLRRFAAEARSLGAADLGRMMESKRLALVAALLRGQVARALDDAAEMFVRLTTRMHNRAKEALDAHRVQHAAETDALVALLRETVLACQDQGAERDARLAVVEGLLLPDADAILAKCEAHAAFAGNNYLPLLTRQYGGQRAAFLRFLAHAALVSTSQDRGVEQAIAFLLAHRTDRRARLRFIIEAVQADGTMVRQALDLSSCLTFRVASYAYQKTSSFVLASLRRLAMSWQGSSPTASLLLTTPTRCSTMNWQGSVSALPLIHCCMLASRLSIGSIGARYQTPIRVHCRCIVENRP